MSINPKVTILLPTYQSEKYLSETLRSILLQTFSDYELLVVYDQSTDKTLDTIKNVRDPRIRVINGSGSGLAAALNEGILNSKGEYVARIDSDDLMVPYRLQKQVDYLDNHPEVIVCGGWQQYFGASTYLHKPPTSAEQCKANLLFRCDLCHSTLMLRKNVFLENKLFYDSAYAAEDFELWTRALDYGEIINLPEVLGYYREDGNSITTQKKEKLILQQGEIVANTLKRNLGIKLSSEQRYYFIGWVNPFYDKKYGISDSVRTRALDDFRQVLEKIYASNHELQYYDEQSLLKVLAAEWKVCRYNAPFEIASKEILSLDQVFAQQSVLKIYLKKFQSFCANYKGLRRKYNKLKTLL